MNKKLIDYTLEAYIEKAKDKTSIPGGGSVCALCGALSGSLGIMVDRLSHGNGDQDQAAIDRINKKIDRLKENIDRDAHSFNQVLHAMKLPKETEGDRKHRAEAMEAGYIHATQVPLAVMEDSLEILSILLSLAKRATKYAITDIYIAADLSKTSIRGAAMTARLNIDQIKDEKMRASMAEKIDHGLRESEELTHEIQKAVQEIMSDK